MAEKTMHPSYIGVAKSRGNKNAAAVEGCVRDAVPVAFVSRGGGEELRKEEEKATVRIVSLAQRT